MIAGLVSPDDTVTIYELVEAVKHENITRTLNLDFRTIEVPQSYEKVPSSNEKVSSSNGKVPSSNEKVPSSNEKVQQDIEMCYNAIFHASIKFCFVKFIINFFYHMYINAQNLIVLLNQQDEIRCVRLHEEKIF